MKQKIIALVDGDNFFAGCEILMNPSLRNKPVCVLSNNDGCVIARSKEAKKLGVPMGVPYFISKRNFSGVIYLSANFTLYHEISQRMMQLLKNYSDKIDIYSIDEAFLDISGTDKIFKMTYSELGVKIRNDIMREIGICVSVGIANSKILAKMAAHKAKSLNGVYIIEKHLIKEELANIPVAEIWGVGKNIAVNLRKFGIFYADEIFLKDDAFFKKNFGKKGLELKYELMGISVIPLTGIIEKPKSIQRTRAFSQFSSDKEYIKTEINIHLRNVCKKLRENNLETGLIYVMLRTKDFRVYCVEKKLDFLTNSEMLLIKETEFLMNKIYKPGVIYRASGVYAGMLQDTIKVQLPLFSNVQKTRSNSISFVLDKIEDKYGRGSISIGKTGIKNLMKCHKRIAKLR